MKFNHVFFIYEYDIFYSVRVFKIGYPSFTPIDFSIPEELAQRLIKLYAKSSTIRLIGQTEYVCSCYEGE